VTAVFGFGQCEAAGRRVIDQHIVEFVETIETLQHQPVGKHDITPRPRSERRPWPPFSNEVEGKQA